ncbi:hypothetical protein BTJ68_06705 [Hortaea werneckii EXF-2000]|uniref:Uncharacterized protein n=1 Tax=Hortaea werneckii EXF-2000 TaxID=1157616 RepID=A0A1Z5TE26_HORWE|nr:hypothetical protein BTJ68_06705 [Hortaea werneckii EXF-2000]
MTLRDRGANHDKREARCDRRLYTQDLVRSKSVDKDDKIKIFDAALDKSDHSLDLMLVLLSALPVILQRHAHAEYAVLMTQSHLNELKGRIDIKTVASSHLEKL